MAGLLASGAPTAPAPSCLLTYDIAGHSVIYLFLGLLCGVPVAPRWLVAYAVVNKLRIQKKKGRFAPTTRYTERQAHAVHL